MEAKINTLEFKKALKKAVRCIANPKRNGLPCLTWAKLEFSNGWLSIHGTTLEHFITIRVPGVTGDNFSMIVSEPRGLIKCLDHFGKDTTITETSFSDGITNIIQLPGDVNEFPPAPPMDDSKLFEFYPDETLKGYKQIKHAISTDEARPVLQGVFFDGDSHIRTTNGFVAATQPISWWLPKMLLPGSLLERLDVFNPHSCISLRLLPKGRVEFFDADITLIGYQIDGNFPDIPGITPKVFEYSLKLDRAALIRNLELLKVNDPAANRVRIADNQMTIQKSETQITINTTLGGTIAKPIAFNIDLLMGALKQFDSPLITLRTHKLDQWPAEISVDGQAGVCLVMPMCWAD
jgi:DNA polymerase III sliding clamp (beta) subunit (PCNA family)